MTELADNAEFVGAPARGRHRRRPHILLIAFSAGICALTVLHLDAHVPVAFMSARESDISASIAVLDQGGPPLLASDVPYHTGIAVSHLRPVGVTDDQGIYVYLPLLSRLTGEKDPAVLMKWFFIGAFGLLVLLYPLIFYELFGSIAVAVAAPVLAIWKFGFTQSLDLYWILAWCMLLGIPGLVLACQWWNVKRRAAVALLVALMLVGSFATSIRIHSGLPLLIGALGIVALTGASWPGLRALAGFWRIDRWWVRPAVAVGLTVAYLSIGTFGLDAMRAYRNHVIHDATFGSTWPTQHPFWHNAYIGLGYLPNTYGIEWNDTVAADAVERARPGTGFLTAAYEAALRHQYLEIARANPGFVLQNFWTKARVLVADAVSRFWLAFVLLPMAMLLGAKRRSIRVAALVAAPAAVLGALAPVLTIPFISYELAWLGTWGALFLLTLGWLWTSAKSALHADLPPDLQALRTRPDPDALSSLRQRLVRAPAAWATAAAVLVTMLLAATARPAVPPNSGSLYAAETSSAFVDSSWLDRRPLRSWTFAGALPSGWTTVAPAFLERDTGDINVHGLYVRSPMTTTQDELAGPFVQLPAGTYDLVTFGRSLVGGFRIDVRAEDGTPIATSGYYSQEGNFLSDAMWLRFKLPAKAKVRVVVSSWSAFANASSWILWSMKLLSANPAALQAAASQDAGFYAAHAASPGSPERGTVDQRWSFVSGMPADWGPVSQAAIGVGDGGTTITTSTRALENQIWSPPLKLGPGRYRFDALGTVNAGGIELGALDTDRNVLLGRAGYWQHQALDGHPMTVRFTVRDHTTIRLVFANWATTSHVSVWTIRHVSLDREH